MRKHTFRQMGAVAIALGVASPFLVNLGPSGAATSDGLFHAWRADPKAYGRKGANALAWLNRYLWIGEDLATAADPTIDVRERLRIGDLLARSQEYAITNPGRHEGHCTVGDRH